MSIKPTLSVPIQWCRNRGGQGGHCPPPPILDRSVNPILIGEGRLCPPITIGPPNFFTFRHHCYYSGVREHTGTLWLVPIKFFSDDCPMVMGQIEPEVLACPHQVCWHSLAPDICIWMWCARGWARKKVIKLGKQTVRVSWTQTPRTVGGIHKWRQNFNGFFPDQILIKMISTLRIALHSVFRCHIWMSPNAM